MGRILLHKESDPELFDVLMSKALREGLEHNVKHEEILFDEDTDILDGMISEAEILGYAHDEWQDDIDDGIDITFFRYKKGC